LLGGRDQHQWVKVSGTAATSRSLALLIEYVVVSSNRYRCNVSVAWLRNPFSGDHLGNIKAERLIVDTPRNASSDRIARFHGWATFQDLESAWPRRTALAAIGPPSSQDRKLGSSQSSNPSTAIQETGTDEGQAAKQLGDFEKCACQGEYCVSRRCRSKSTHWEDGSHVLAFCSSASSMCVVLIAAHYARDFASTRFCHIETLSHSPAHFTWLSAGHDIAQRPSLFFTKCHGCTQGHHQEIHSSYLSLRRVC
jgi:hypothetical protein